MSPLGNGTGSGIKGLRDLFASTSDLPDFLHGLAGLTAEAFGGDVSCGITVIRDGQPATVASSDRRASEVDEVQYRLDAGPCLHCARTNETVLVADMASDVRWPDFGRRAVDAGIRSSLSNPLPDLDDLVGALNLYAPEPRTFRTDEQQRASAFADEASHAIALAARLSDQEHMLTQLREALETRPVIDRAIGMIMAQNRCSAGRAFAILKSASQNSNTKLRDVASRIVEQADVPRDDPPPFR